MLELTRLFSLLVITLPLLASGINSATLTFFNQCNYTVWPALDSDKNVKFSTTGFVLETGETFRLDAPSTWTGRVWGRTECYPNPATGNLSCSTGDCDTGKVECGSRGGSPPVTLVEIGAGKNNIDSYYVSLEEGFNIPMKVAPTSGNCSSSECSEDVNAVCPTNLQIIIKNKLVACNSTCPASNQSNCDPHKYTEKFNNTCPKAYTKSRNNQNDSTLSCSSPTDFDIIFCPLAAPTFGNASRRVGDSLTAGYKSYRWLSPSGDFAFGFYQLPNELYLLAIWFDKIPDRTIIWYANGDNLAPKGSMLTLNDSHGLILSNPQGLEVWKSNFNSSTILYGLMNDDGNFQLLDQNFVPLWESFTYPTDTLVPNQVIKLNGEISSRHGEFNFSRGRFKLHLEKDGNLVLDLVDLFSNYNYERYYASGTVDSINETNVGMKLIFKKSGELYILKKSGDMFSLNKPNETNGFYKATINFDGVFTVTFYQKDQKKGQGWITRKAIPKNICLNSTFINGVGICGFNSICKLKDDQRPMCNCSKEYSLISSSDTYGGCMLKFPNPSEKKDHDTLIVVMSVLFGNSMLVNIMFTGAICFGFSYYRKKIKSDQTKNNVVDNNLRNFTFKELLEATRNFKEELGRGSFSIVYKGTIEMTHVAVKKLDKLFQDNDKEFQTEMNVIGQTHHRNLVRLLGYCNEGQHRILVYEFMSNGTLASFLFTHPRPNLSKRFNIALGIARGLVYLHEECCTQIIHCDIKAQNILLDYQYNARISDFGLAKLLLINQSHTETRIRGTKGYVAPDWFRSTPITAKVDTYSFGVLLLEIICCRRNVEKKNVNEEKGILTDWAYDCYKTKRLDILLENDDEAIDDIKSFEKLVMIAIWCLHEDPSLRPTMKKALLMLEGIVEVLIPPSPYLNSSVS